MQIPSVKRLYRIDASTLHESIRAPLIGVKSLDNSMELDLCLNNILGVINTKLMYAYSQLHPKVQQVLCFL